MNSKKMDKVTNAFTGKQGPEHLIEQVLKNEDCRVVATLGNGVIIMKKLELSVNVPNHNSVFGAAENIKEKNYCVMAILEYKPWDKACYHVDTFVNLGCPIYIVNSSEDVEKAIKELV